MSRISSSASSFARFHWVYLLVLMAVGWVAGLFLPGVSIPTAQAGWDTRATANPCANYFEDQRSRRPRTPIERRLHGQPFLYNGMDDLAARLDRPIPLSSGYTGEWKAACVVFEVVLGGRDGDLSVQQARPLVVYPPRRSDLMPGYQQDAEAVLRQIPLERVLRNKPMVGVPQLVAIPLWPAHPFYSTDSVQIAGPTSNDLAEYGYGAAERIAEGSDFAVYKVSEGRNKDTLQTTFVVLRDWDEQAPILRLREVSTPVPFGSVVQRVPEGPVGDIFEQHIKPWLARQPARTLRADVRYYARGLSIPFDQRNSLALLSGVTNPVTGQPAAHPLFTALYVGNRQPGTDAVQWAYNVSEPGNATITELRQRLAKVHLFKEERLRIAREQGVDLDAPKKRRAELRAQRLKIQAERSPDYVYKSDRFWAVLPQFYIPQQVFNGDFDKFQVNTQFPEHFVRYVNAYSAHCEDEIKKGGYLKRTIITMDDLGNVMNQRHIYVEDRFVPYFKAYEKILGFKTMGDVARLLLDRQGDAAALGAEFLSTSPRQFINDLMTYQPRGKGNLAKEVLSRHLGGNHAWQQFLGNHHCTSPTVYQMRENMLRVAKGEPSLQAAGIRVRNAATETEPLVPPPGRETLFDGCYADHDYKNADFCLCMDERGQKVMTPAEVKKYAADFSLFYSENVFAQKNGPGDPRWRLSGLVKECKR